MQRGTVHRAGLKLFISLLVGGMSVPDLACSAQADRSSTAPELRGLIAEASHRFDLPIPWIYAVMSAESAFDPAATSRVGAMGLMQVMPETYRELRPRYGLGPDPYAPRDNVLAGAAYLRELYDRFGPGGFLAAYNAGPGRYTEHLRTGRPLPLETRLYVRRILYRLAIPRDQEAVELVKTHAPSRPPAPSPENTEAASLFVDLHPRPAPLTSEPSTNTSLFVRSEDVRGPQ